MLNRYALQGQGLTSVSNAAFADILWVDLLEPTAQEELTVESQCGVDVPTRESLGSLGRALAFVQQSAAINLSNDVRARFRTRAMSSR